MSVAVIDCVPAVSSVAVKMTCPWSSAAKVKSAGSDAPGGRCW